MTKDEAIQKMKMDLKVTHRFFTKDEYIYLKGSYGRMGNIIYSEDGVCHGFITDFFEERKLNGWENNWDIFNK